MRAVEKIAPHKIIEKNFLWYPGASKDKDKPVYKNTNREEAIQKVNEVAIGADMRQRTGSFKGPKIILNISMLLPTQMKQSESGRLLEDNLEKGNGDD